MLPEDDPPQGWHRQGQQDYGGTDLESREEVPSVCEDWMQNGRTGPK